MLYFGMNMPFYYMALYGSIMIVIVLLLRAFLKERLPKFVFPVLWGVVLLRLLVPFSVSSPLSLPVPSASILAGLFPDNPFLKKAENTAMEQVVAHYDAFVSEGMSEGAVGTDVSMDNSTTFIEESIGVEEGSADFQLQTQNMSVQRRSGRNSG